MPASRLISGHSLLGRFVRWLVIPLLLLWAANAVIGYQISSNAANLAYDRTLLASARIISDQTGVENGKIHVEVPYSALDNFEYDNRGQMFYRVSDFEGRFIAGYADLPRMPAGTPRTDIYPALVHFHDSTYRGKPVRMATFFKPLIEGGLQGMVRIEVAETIQARQFIALRVLKYTVLSQGLLVLFALVLVAFALRRILQPIRVLGDEVKQRAPDDFSDLHASKTHSELQPLIDAINEYRHRLGGLLARYRRFAADASHQLRTPLAVMTTQTEHALRDGSPEVMRESLQALKQSLRRTTRLTNQLLLLARIDAGSHKLPAGQPYPPFDLDAMVEKVILSRLEMARGKDIDLGVDRRSRKAGLQLRGNEVLIEEVLLNLLDNAIRHSPQHGVVTLRLLDCARYPGGIEIEIEDNGPGIPAEARERVFERFCQLPDAAPGGSGLGLAIVRDVCRLHQADINLHDAASGGLLVRLAFRP